MKKSKQKRVSLGIVSILRYTDYGDDASVEFVSKAGVGYRVPAFLLAEDNAGARLIECFEENYPQIEIDPECREAFMKSTKG